VISCHFTMQFKTSPPYRPASAGLPENEDPKLVQLFKHVEQKYCPGLHIRNQILLEGIATGKQLITPLDGSKPYLKLALYVKPALWEVLFGIPLSHFLTGVGVEFIPVFSNVKQYRYFPWAVHGNSPVLVIKIKNEDHYRDIDSILDSAPNEFPDVSVMVKNITYSMTMDGQRAHGVALIATSPVILTNGTTSA
jgi:hypothetical protein